MELLFKALDGEIFKTQEECEDYESKIMAKNFEEDLNRIIYLTSICGEIKIVPIKEVKCFYTYDVVYIPDEKALRAIKTLSNFKYSGVRVGYNFRVYRGDIDEWVVNRIEELIEEKELINQEIKVFETKVFHINQKLLKKNKEDIYE